MHPYFVVTIVLAAISLMVGVLGRYYLRSAVALILSGAVAREWIYSTRQQEDAFWLLVELVVMSFDILAVAVGLLLGWLVHERLQQVRAARTADEPSESD